MASNLEKYIGKLNGTYDGDIPEPGNGLEKELKSLVDNSKPSGGGSGSLVLIAAANEPGGDLVLCKTEKGSRRFNNLNTLRVPTGPISVSEFLDAIQNGDVISFIECYSGLMEAYVFEGIFFNDRNSTYEVSFYGVNGDDAIVRKNFNSTIDRSMFVMNED